jgi:hypothetical protein
MESIGSACLDEQKEGCDEENINLHGSVIVIHRGAVAYGISIIELQTLM